MMQLVTRALARPRGRRPINTSRLGAFRAASTDMSSRHPLKMRDTPATAFREHLDRARNREDRKTKARQEVSNLCVRARVLIFSS